MNCCPKLVKSDLQLMTALRFNLTARALGGTRPPEPGNALVTVFPWTGSGGVLPMSRQDRRSTRKAQPMSSHFNDPAYWRARGEEVRTIAEDLKDSGAKRMLLDVAADYEVLAQRAEQRLAGCDPVGTP